MSGDDKTIEAPVSLDMQADGVATLTFGPMPIEDLDALLENLSDGAEFARFRTSLEEAIVERLNAVKKERSR